MKLIAGERFTLQENFAIVKTGTLDIFADVVGDGSFRQEFLITLGSGGAAFPAFDDFEQVEIIIYAVENSEIEICKFEDLPPENLREFMSNWFESLVKVQWLELLADKGDDTLINWRNREIFTDNNIVETFMQQTKIFSTLLGVRFASQDKRFERRIESAARQQNFLFKSGVSNLTGEPLQISENHTNLEEITFIVQSAAKSLELPTENIKLSPEFTRNLMPEKIIRRLAAKGNMQVRRVELLKDWTKTDNGTLIGEYDGNFAAFIQNKPGNYQVVTGKGTFPVEESKAAKDAFECYAGFTSDKITILNLIKIILGQCWKIDYVTVIVVGMFSGLIPLVMPLVTETIFADIIPLGDRAGLATVTQVTLVTSFTMAGLGIVRSIAVLRLSSKISMSAQSGLIVRLLRLPSDFFRKFTSGEVAQRISGLSVVTGLISPDFVGGVFSLLFSFWSLFLMCYYSIKLTAVGIVVWILYSIVTAFIYRRVLFFQRNLIKASNAESGLIMQLFTGLGKFKEHGALARAYYKWSEVFGETWKWNLKLRWQSNYTALITSVEPFILNMAMYYFAMYGTNNPATGETGLTYPEFIAFSAAFGSFNASLNGIIPLVGQYFAIQPQLENFRPILEATPEKLTEGIDAPALSGAIEIKNLHFKYETGGEVLHDINFKISSGENIAIVGSSGSGKSTLVRLLLGFEKPTAGSIFFDGLDLSELNLQSVRSQMGVVLQTAQLMSGSIFENIVGTAPLPQEAAWAAAAAAGLDEDIAAMPMGMSTMISEGSSNISGGQRQRILIARALANNPAILIFDEATSALDNRTQAIVTKSLESLKNTRIIVAHRLSTIRNCDRILVMDKGQIVENGTFDELVSRGGIFSKLVQRQIA